VVWKSSNRKQPWPVLKYYSSTYVEELKKASESLRVTEVPETRIEHEIF